MMIVKCGRDSRPEFLEREGATQYGAAVLLGEPGANQEVGVQDGPDRTKLFHHIRIASFEKPGVADEQVDPYTTRPAESRHRVIADENAITRRAQCLVDQVLRGSVFLENDDRRGCSWRCWARSRCLPSRTISAGSSCGKTLPR